MHKTLRQMILGLGTFGTGTALLYLDVNPYLLILTDTVVGIGMLFAAGSLTVDDLHLRRGGVAGDGSPSGTAGTGPEAVKESGGFRLSLGKLGGSLRPSLGRVGTSKEEKEAHANEIDRMLDTALAGESKRLISIAEGRGTATGPAAPAAADVQAAEDPLQAISAAGIAAPFADEATAEEGDEEVSRGPDAVKPRAPPSEEVSPAALEEPEEMRIDAPADVLSLSDGGAGADDLLSALRLEALKEKKRDDTSLLRDLKGVKVSGKQLLEELDSLVRDIRGR